MKRPMFLICSGRQKISSVFKEYILTFKAISDIPVKSTRKVIAMNEVIMLENSQQHHSIPVFDSQANAWKILLNSNILACAMASDFSLNFSELKL